MRKDFLKLCIDLCHCPPTFFESNRKIVRKKVFTMKTIKNDLFLDDCGYTSTKLGLLKKLYIHEESIQAAVPLWRDRLKMEKYGSVSFHCFNHYVKAKKSSTHSSVMGPCIQAISLTLLNNGTTSVDCFYRATEIFKKFPADLVFLYHLIFPYFDLDENPISEINFYFANISIHPMYFPVIMPLLKDPIGEIEKIKQSDEYFYYWIIKWASKYMLPERFKGIANHAQSMSVKRDIDKRMIKDKDKIIEYLRKNHP